MKITVKITIVRTVKTIFCSEIEKRKSGAGITWRHIKEIKHVRNKKMFSLRSVSCKVC